MQHVDLSTAGYEKYTVYEITNSAKRYMSDATAPVFEADTGGDANFVTVTPYKIDYAGGRIYLSTARGVGDVVQCHSGKYFTTITALLGASVSRITYGPQLVEVPLLGDTYVRRFPTVTDWTFTVDAYKCKGVAEYSTAMAGDNNDIRFEHSPGGTVGNSYSITMVDPGGDGSLSVAVAGTDVTVTLAYSGGKITSTANDVIALVNADGSCADIGFRAYQKAGNTGVGVVTALGKQSLTGGLDAQEHTAKKGVKLIAIFYYNSSGDARYEGYCYLETDDFSFDPKNVQLESLTFKGSGPLCRRTS
jgi:hypothetical protein